MREFVVGHGAMGAIVVDGKNGGEAAYTNHQKRNITVETGGTFDVFHLLKTRSPPAKRFGEDTTFPNTTAGGGADLRRRYII